MEKLRLEELKKLCEDANKELVRREDELNKYKHEKLISFIKHDFGLSHCINIGVWSISGGSVSVTFSCLSLSCWLQDNVFYVKYMIEPQNYIWRGFPYIYKKGKIFPKEKPGSNSAANLKMYNPEIFREIATIMKNKSAIYKKYEKYSRLIFCGYYLNIITFLLCSKKKFPHDIAKLITQKIFFIKLKKKKEKNGV